MSSSDIEIPGSSDSDSEPGTLGQVCVALERVSFKGKQYVWKAHEDNQPAFTKPFIIW
jgi:hypothetical protein